MAASEAGRTIFVFSEHVGLMLMEAAALEMSGDFAEALRRGEIAHHPAEAAGDPSGRSSALSSLGIIYFRLGNNARALELSRQSLALNESTPSAVIAWNLLGLSIYSTDDWKLAEECSEKAQRLSQEIGYRFGIISVLQVFS